MVGRDAKFTKYIYSHSRKYVCTQSITLHPATLYLCSFKELYLFNFKEIIYLLTVKEINPFKEHIFIHKKYNHSRQLSLNQDLQSTVIDPSHALAQNCGTNCRSTLN